MEQWEALIESYTEDGNLRAFSKIVKSADAVLKEDLATFEIDWVLESIFSDPVNLLSVLVEHKADDAWSRVTGEALTLVTTLLQTKSEHLELYIEDIIKACNQSYQPYISKRATSTLIEVARSVYGARLEPYIPRLRDALRRSDEPLSLRVPLAQLLGLISEFYPEIMKDCDRELWRAYLVILESSKTKDSLVNGVILGINGLLKHFGTNLPTSELNVFYDKLTTRHIVVSVCKEASLKFLELHSSLFPEKIAGDEKLRVYLWKTMKARHGHKLTEATISVYSVLATTCASLDDIIQKELYKKFQSSNDSVRNTSFRIMSIFVWQHRDKVSADLAAKFVRLVTQLSARLEFNMEEKLDCVASVDEQEKAYDNDLIKLMEQASWCVSHSAPGSDNLLRCLISLYPHCYTKNRRKLVVHPILSTAAELRSAAVAFLISESSKNDKMFQNNDYMSLWREIFDSKNGKDVLVLEKSRLLFDEFVNAVLIILTAFIEKRGFDSQFTQEKLSSILRLSSQVLSIEYIEDWLSDFAEILFDVAIQILDNQGLNDGLILFLATLAEKSDRLCLFENGCIRPDVIDHLKGFYESLQIDRCRNEMTLCAACLALIQAPTTIMRETKGILTALQVIFSRSDVESGTLTKALQKFEVLLNEDKSIDPYYVSLVMRQIEILRDSKNLTGKEARVLHRDVLMFLGKYAKREVNNNKYSVVDSLKIKEKLILSLPNNSEGTHYKMNLQRLCDLAITHEDPKSLHSLLLILCANSTNTKDTNMEEALTAVVHRMSRCHSRGDGLTALEELEHAVLLFDKMKCVEGLVQHITKETSPGVRRMLADVMEAILTVDPLANDTRTALKSLMEKCSIMMANQNPITKRAGLDLTESFVIGLKGNNELFREFMPDLLVNILKTNEKDLDITYNVALQAFTEKIALFQPEILDSIMVRIIENLLNRNDSQNRMLVTKSIETISVISQDNYDGYLTKLFSCICQKDCENVQYFSKLLHLLSESREKLDFDLDTCRRIVSYDGFLIVRFCNKFSQNHDLDVRSVFRCLSVYADVLLEFEYQKTLELLSTFIRNLPTTAHFKSVYPDLEKCIVVYRGIWKNNLPNIIKNSIHGWFKSVAIAKITRDLQNRIFEAGNTNSVVAMKKMLLLMKIDRNSSIFADEIYEDVKKWSKIVLNIYVAMATNTLRSKMAYLTDAMTVSLFFMNDEEITDILKYGLNVNNVNSKFGLEFFRGFVGAFVPYVLNSDILKNATFKTHLPSIVGVIIKYYTQRNCDISIYEDIIKMVDNNWSTIEEGNKVDNFALLINLSSLNQNTGLNLDSKAGRWFLKEMTTDHRDDPIILMEVLPCFLKNTNINEESNVLLSSAIKCYASGLPRRLSEFSDRSEPKLLKAILNALSCTGNSKLLDIVMKLAIGDETTGWWDAAVESCAMNLATKSDLNAALDLYKFSQQISLLSPRLLTRILLPLLRYSSPEFCEKFYSRIVENILSTMRKELRVSPNVNEYLHMKSLVDYTASLMLAQVMCEKVSATSLESPTSVLYENLQVDQNWYIIRELCKLCVSLRSKTKLPSVAGDDWKQHFRQFQCANYNCLAATLSKRQPDLKFFNALFADDVWSMIVDCERTYKIYIDLHGRVSNKRHLVSVTTDECLRDPATRTALTSRTGLFMRTLSDDPLKYDFLTEETVENEPSSSTTVLLLADNDLNAHECTATLSAILRQLSTLTDDPRPYWIDKMAAVLTNDSSPNNVKWFIAQVICNCSDLLKRNIEALFPALMKVVARTPYEKNGKKYLNGLHVTIMNMLISWSKIDDSQSDDMIEESELSDALSQITKFLIDTCIDCRELERVSKTLKVLLTGILTIYGKYITMSWDMFESYLSESDASIVETCLQLLIIIGKNNIYIPELLPAVMNKLENASRTNMAELFGLAISSCQSDTVKNDSLSMFLLFLKRLRQKNTVDYVKVLFYAQSGCKECCDMANFRLIVDLAPKMAQTNKEKCFQIISKYIENTKARNEYISDMFDTIEISDAIIGDYSYVALNIAKNGLNLMNDSLKRRIVFLSVNYCNNSVTKLRRNAYQVVLKAFEDVCQEESSEPRAKKRRTDSSASKIMKLFNKDDMYENTILRQIGFGLMDEDTIICEELCDCLQKILTKNDINTRFCECFIIILLMTSRSSQSEASSSGGSKSRAPSKIDQAKRTAVFVKLLFRDLRERDFVKARLRDKPLENVRSQASSKLLTMSRTYQGTFRTEFKGSKINRTARKQASNKTTLNVQMSVEEIFNDFVAFAENNPEASSAIFMEIFNSVSAENATLKQTVSPLLGAILKEDHAAEVTPDVVEMCRLCIRECSKIDGFSDTVEMLRQKYRGTEGENITHLLYEDLCLNVKNEDLFVFKEFVTTDVEMQEDKVNIFKLEDLMATFGMLSNWENLTTSQKKSKMSALPPLWTDHGTFLESLENYTTGDDWLAKMRCVWKREQSGQHFKWLRQLDAWPRRDFHISVVTEAIDLHNIWLSSEYRELPITINPQDCLAEWAARLMARSVVTSAMLVDSQRDDDVTSRFNRFNRQQELVWAKEANRRGLWEQCLLCIDRNVEDLFESEVSDWFLQRIVAYRNKALMASGVEFTDKIMKIIDNAETSIENFYDNSKPETLLEIQRIMLVLNNDLKPTDTEKTDDILDKMNRLYENMDGNKITNTVIENISSANQHALWYSDKLWGSTEDPVLKQSILQTMLRCTKNIISYDRSATDGAVCVLLNMTVSCKDAPLDVDVAKSVLEMLNNSSCDFDELVWDALKILKAKSPSVFNGLQHINERFSDGSKETEYYKACLKHVRCTRNSISQYCDRLMTKLFEGDEDGWGDIVADMDRNLFDTSEVGLEYQLLSTYKSKLHEIRDFAHTDEFKKKVRSIVQDIKMRLQSQEARTVVSLNDLCPALAHYSSDGCEKEGRYLESLLHVERQLYIVKFENEVRIFANSIQKPTLIRLLLSDGTKRRYLLKCGVDLRQDAASQRFQRYVNRVSGYDSVTYEVTPLGRDFGVIEFLEDCVTLRAMISSEHNIDDIETSVRRPRDDQLILSPTAASVSQYKSLCQKTSPSLLRSAIEKRSASIQDFIKKKSRYMDSLAAMTVSQWILGLGDRHLENTLICARDGRACAVDWADLFESDVTALASPVLLPARLTRQLLGVACDNDVLKSRIECILGEVRASRCMLSAVTNMAFLWRADYNTSSFQTKLKRVHGKLNGTISSYDCTREALQETNLTHKDKYIALLDNSCMRTDKNEYTVEEQVDILLHQCTNPALLSVTRSAWEPWL